jgi:lysophospholipase L1-like esterase
MDDSSLPRVLILGDSISLGYTPHVERELASRARVVHHEGNSGDSANVLRNLDGWLAAAGARLIHFNVGLHDLRFWTKYAKYQVPLEEYRRNLAAMVERLRAAGAALIWATTTPVLDGAPGMSRDFPRKNADVEAYNAAALEAVRAADIPVNDLHAFVKARGVHRTILPDGVHLTDEGYAAAGAEVARIIREVLAERGW